MILIEVYRHANPWSNTRQLLWGVGVFGLLLFCLALVSDHLFGGLDVDGRQPPLEKNWVDWLFDLGIGFTLVYYTIAASLNWSVRMWRFGITIHVVTLGLFVAALFGGKRPTGSPLIIPGFVTWLVYSRQQNRSA